MQPQRRSSLRSSSKRKPLSDCTNTLHHPTILQSKTLIKPPKNPSSNQKPPKSNSSTGSNNSPNSITHVASIPHLLDSSASFNINSHYGGTDFSKSKVTADQIQRQETIKKDKGKMFAETPIIQLSESSSDKTLQISSTASPSLLSHSATLAVEDQNAYIQKDKRKISEDAPATDSLVPFTSKYLQVSSSSGCSFSGNSPEYSQELLEERRKLKGKMVLETPNIEASEPLTPCAPIVSLDASGSENCSKSKETTDQIQMQNTTKKDKGKMVVETPVIQLSESLSSKTLQLSSPALPDNSSHSGMQAVQNQNSGMQKDKGMVTEDAPFIESPAPFTTKYLQMSSSLGSSLSETSRVHSQELFEERRKVTGKMVVEAPNMEAYSTPCAPIVSLAASGMHDRTLTDYNRRRSQRGRKRAADKINVALSCPPDHRSKKKRLEVDSDRGFKYTGSLTDPLPVAKKKRSRDKYGMPKEEVEKLKTYFADIDAFELPVEEVTSENELE